MIPATWVPCPYGSWRLAFSPVKSIVIATWPLSAGADAMPESITAIPMPAPVYPATPLITPAQTWSAPIARVASAAIRTTGTSPER